MKPFPWPPPKASATEVLPATVFRPNVKTLGDVDKILSSALDTAGYVERGYFSVPAGFAIVTRMEQIYHDGRPKPAPARFSTIPVPLTKFTLGDYFRALLTADPGYYRVMVLVVTPHSFPQAEKAPTERAAETWRGGNDSLTHPIAEKLNTPETKCTVLIYEFKKPAKAVDHEAVAMDPSDIDSRSHLKQSGIWRALHLH
jgi:hypothetical protein